MTSDELRTNGSGGLLDYLRSTAPALPEEVVHVPEWAGRAVTLRGMTARERDLFEEQAIRRGEAKAAVRSGNGFRQPPRGRRGDREGAAANVAAQMDLDNFRARLVAKTIWENGGRPFDNDEGVRVLGGQPIRVIMRLFEVAQRLNGMTAEDVEELEKNYDGTDGDGSSSDSPSPSDEPSPSSPPPSPSAS